MSKQRITNCIECHAEYHRDDCPRLARMPEGLRNVVRRGEALRRQGLRVYGDQLIGPDGRPVSNDAAAALLRETGLAA